MNHTPLELVTVLETRDTFALTLAKAALEEAEIDYVVTGDEPGYIAGFTAGIGTGLMPLSAFACRIQVLAERASEARALLEPLEHPELTDPAESQSEPEP